MQEMQRPATAAEAASVHEDVAAVQAESARLDNLLAVLQSLFAFLPYSTLMSLSCPIKLALNELIKAEIVLSCAGCLAAATQAVYQPAVQCGGAADGNYRGGL